MKDRFVGRRGIQGDSWQWERVDHPDKPLPFARITRTPAAAARNAADRLATSTVSAFATVGAVAQRPFVTFGRALRESLSRDARPEPPARPPSQEPAPGPPVGIELPPPATAMPSEPLVASAEIGAEPEDIAAPTEPVTPPSRRPFATFRMPAMAMPRMARPGFPKMPRPALPQVVRPRFQRSGVRMKMPEISEAMRAPMILFAVLGLGAVLAIVVALGVILGDNDSDGALFASATATPEVTEPAAEPTPPAVTPRTTKPAATATPPAPTTTPPVVVSPPTPAGGVSVGLWSNVSGQWWFGDLSAQTGQYKEGEFLPIIGTFAATPGHTYAVSVVYDCATDDASGAFDYLSGIDAYGATPYTAPGGPGKARPDAAIPVPDTDGFAPDNGAFGTVSLFGAHFGGIPGSPLPGGDCDRQRALQLLVVADRTQVTLILGGHLASEATWGVDEGAASHGPPFGIEVTVSGVGTARANVTAGTVALR